MDRLGHRRALQVIQALPCRAEPLSRKVLDNECGHVPLPARRLLPGQRHELPEFLRRHRVQRELQSGYPFFLVVVVVHARSDGAPRAAVAYPCYLRMPLERTLVYQKLDRDRLVRGCVPLPGLPGLLPYAAAQWVRGLFHFHLRSGMRAGRHAALGLYHDQSRNQPEAACVTRRHRVALFDGRGADRQIVERDRDPFGSLLAADASDDLVSLIRNWMHWDVTLQIVNEHPPPLLPFWRIRPVDAVHQTRPRSLRRLRSPPHLHSGGSAPGDLPLSVPCVPRR